MIVSKAYRQGRVLLYAGDPSRRYHVYAHAMEAEVLPLHWQNQLRKENPHFESRRQKEQEEQARRKPSVLSGSVPQHIPMASARPPVEGPADKVSPLL